MLAHSVIPAASECCHYLSSIKTTTGSDSRSFHFFRPGVTQRDRTLVWYCMFVLYYGICHKVWRHCHSLSVASVKSRLVLPFWYWLTRVVPEERPLNGCVCVCVYGDSVDNTVENFSVFSIISNAPVAASKGMRAVKLCTNKILQFLNGGAC